MPAIARMARSYSETPLLPAVVGADSSAIGLPPRHVTHIPPMKKPGTWPGFFMGRSRSDHCTSTARFSAIFFCQMAGPVMCTDSPLVSTATVTGMSFTSNS